jgi:hypothetical protein
LKTECDEFPFGELISICQRATADSLISVKLRRR